MPGLFYDDSIKVRGTASADLTFTPTVASGPVRLADVDLVINALVYEQFTVEDHEFVEYHGTAQVDGQGPEYRAKIVRNEGTGIVYGSIEKSSLSRAHFYQPTDLDQFDAILDMITDNRLNHAQVLEYDFPGPALNRVATPLDDGPQMQGAIPLPVELPVLGPPEDPEDVPGQEEPPLRTGSYFYGRGPRNEDETPDADPVQTTGRMMMVSMLKTFRRVGAPESYDEVRPEQGCDDANKMVVKVRKSPFRPAEGDYRVRGEMTIQVGRPEYTDGVLNPVIFCDASMFPQESSDLPFELGISIGIGAGYSLGPHVGVAGQWSMSEADESEYAIVSGDLSGAESRHPFHYFADDPLSDFASTRSLGFTVNIGTLDLNNPGDNNHHHHIWAHAVADYDRYRHCDGLCLVEGYTLASDLSGAIWGMVQVATFDAGAQIAQLGDYDVATVAIRGINQNPPVNHDVWETHLTWDPENQNWNDVLARCWVRLEGNEDEGHISQAHDVQWDWWHWSGDEWEMVGNPKTESIPDLPGAVHEVWEDYSPRRWGPTTSTSSWGQYQCVVSVDGKRVAEHSFFVYPTTAIA